MALSIKSDEADRLARELSALTGETLTDTVTRALRERLERQRARSDGRPLDQRLLAIGRKSTGRPLLDARPADVILGYDHEGLPT